MTAKVLDPRRLNKQVLECDWILHAGPDSRVRNHPIYKMYKDNLEFVEYYRKCMSSFRSKWYGDANAYSDKALSILPDFLRNADWYFDNFKKRLYTKDPEFYKQFESYGTSEHNYYYVNGEWLEY